MTTDELRTRWHSVLRGAARATFPKSTPMRTASYLAGHLVVAERLTEEQARARLSAAARAAGIHRKEADRIINDAYSLGRIHALKERLDGGVEGDRPGAFTAVASASETYDHDNNFFIDPKALLPLPAGTLIHRGHADDSPPVGIGIPTYSNGVIRVEAILASAPSDSWTLLRTGCLRNVSIKAAIRDFHRGIHGRLSGGVLVSVDLVRRAYDDRATVGKVIDGGQLTPAQREVQRLLDRYLSDARSPRAPDFLVAAERRGVAAMDVLAPIVAPRVEERARRALRVA